MMPLGDIAQGARPLLHFSATAGWINDAHTLVHHEGVYHLFFQYVPGSVEWTPSCHWGHATSLDLIQWEEHPPALSPGDGDDGCWSGSMALGPVPTIFYTAVHEPGRELGAVRLARPDDAGWQRWTKGPTVVGPPRELDLRFFRDPFVLRDGDGWRMLVGAGFADRTAGALTYTSMDLDDWSYDGVLASRPSDRTDGTWTGTGWECPTLLRVDGRDILLVSVWDSSGPQYEAYSVGSLAGGRFTGGTWRRLSHGSYYAGAAFSDAAGRPGLIHWLRGVSDPAAGWAGAHSLPQLLRVDRDRLLARPHDVVDSLRCDPAEVLGQGPAGWCRVKRSLPLDAEWTPGSTGGTLGLPELALALEASDGELNIGLGERTYSVGWDPGETVRLLVDGPVAEIFTRDGIVSGPVASPAATTHLHMEKAGTLRTWKVPALLGSGQSALRTAQLP